MEEEEKKSQEQTDEGMIDIESQTHRGRKISNQSLHDAIRSERILRQRILSQSDECADERPGHRTAPHQREVHRYQQRQIEIRQKAEEQRNVDLKQYRDQRDHEQHPGPEPGYSA